jgi:hypothetical protein
MSATKEFTYSDVSEHASKKDLYIVVHDKVYDCTSFVDEHPYVCLPRRCLVDSPPDPLGRFPRHCHCAEGAHGGVQRGPVWGQRNRANISRA